MRALVTRWGRVSYHVLLRLYSFSGQVPLGVDMEAGVKSSPVPISLPSNGWRGWSTPAFPGELGRLATPTRCGPGRTGARHGATAARPEHWPAGVRHVLAIIQEQEGSDSQRLSAVRARPPPPLIQKALPSMLSGGQPTRGPGRCSCGGSWVDPSRLACRQTRLGFKSCRRGHRRIAKAVAYVRG